MDTSPNDVPPDTTAEINSDGIVFLRQARLFSDEPVMVEQFSWDEINGGKIEVDDIASLTVDNENSDVFSATLQAACVSFEGQRDDIEQMNESVEMNHGSPSKTLSVEEIWSELESSYGIEYDGNSDEIVFNETESDKQNYVNFFEYLSKESLLRDLEIPYKSKSAKNYTLNNEPELREGKEMARPVKISEDMWLETQIPKNQKKGNMIRVVSEISGEGG